MKSIRFHPEAETEMIEAAAFYEAQQSGLGRRFLTSIQDGLNRILINPRLFPVADLDVRRCLAKTFPFGILFRASSCELNVVAVMHLHRDPEYWKNR